MSIKTIANIRAEVFRVAASDVTRDIIIEKRQNEHFVTLYVPAGPLTERTVRMTVDLRTLLDHATKLSVAP